MADDQNAGTTPQAGAATQPQAGTIPPTAPQAGTDTTAQQPTMTLEDAQRIIADLRKESASHRTKLTAFEKAQADAEAAKLSDIDKATKRAEAAETQAKSYQQRIAGLTVQAEAAKLNIIDPEAAALLIAGQLEYGDDGLPTNAAKLLGDLVKERKWLLASAASGQPAPRPPTSGGATNPGRAAGNGGLTLDAIKAMPMRERMARMDEIRAWEKANAQQTTP